MTNNFKRVVVKVGSSIITDGEQLSFERLEKLTSFINTLKKQNLITIIKEELDIKLEIPHLAFLEAKKELAKKYAKSQDELKELGDELKKTGYGQYLLKIAKEN